MITVRYNFETNSSSMHSLAIRSNSERYSEAELRHAEVLSCSNYQDAILVMKDTIDKTYVDKFYDYRPHDGKYNFSSYDVDFKRTAMSVQCTFWNKMHYLASLALSEPEYQGMWPEIQAAVNKFYGEEIELSTKWIRNDYFGLNSDLVGRFLKERNISVYDFLADPRYLVIINVSEFFKMQWLNMVDMSQVEEMVCELQNDNCERAMDVQDGVWHLRECDLCFGRSPYRVLGSVEGKARYALATYGGIAEKREEIISIIKSVYPEIKEVAFPLCSYSQKPSYGYAEDSCLPLNISLRDFILDKKYVVISDGDEYCIWSDFKMTPLFNQNEYPDETIDED